MNNATITQVYDNCVNKGKKTLFLVLKKKSEEKQIIEDIEKELEHKMKLFLQKILPKIQNLKFENPEKSLRVIILKGLINALKDLIKQYFGELSQNDQNLINGIMDEDEKNSPATSKFNVENNKNTDNNNFNKTNPHSSLVPTNKIIQTHPSVRSNQIIQNPPLTMKNPIIQKPPTVQIKYSIKPHQNNPSNKIISPSPVLQTNNIIKSYQNIPSSQINQSSNIFKSNQFNQINRINIFEGQNRNNQTYPPASLTKDNQSFQINKVKSLKDYRNKQNRERERKYYFTNEKSGK